VRLKLVRLLALSLALVVPLQAMAALAAGIGMSLGDHQSVVLDHDDAKHGHHDGGHAIPQAAEQPCESMGMPTMPKDCCGDDMSLASCLTACLAMSPAVQASVPMPEASAAVAAPIPHPFLRHASILAAPDAAPPKALVS
jgi:hypothetical protein